MAQPVAPQRSLPFWLVLAVFALAAATLIIRAVVGSGTTPLFADTDDAMRMVVVRDFLGGQNWFDIVQHRLNTPFGAEVHWSRLVDLPIAILIRLVSLVAPDHAETIVAYFWPLALLLALLWIIALLCRRLVGPDGVLPGLVLPVLSPAVTAEFTPGRMDHHSTQIILTLVLTWASIEAIQRPRWAIGAGIVAATAMAIATESVPAVATALAVFALLWVMGAMSGRALRWFGLSFAGASLVHLAIALPPSRWLTPACDVLSDFYVGGAVVAGVLFLALSLWPARHTNILLRLVALALGGAIGIAATLAIDPLCLHGPYAALDPWLMHHWIDAIAEAKPWWNSLWDLPGYTIAVGIPGILGIIVILVRLARVPDQRTEWLALLLFLAMATLVTALQVRGSRLMIMPAVPAAAWLIASARNRYLVHASILSALALLTAWLAFAGIVVILLVGVAISNIPGRAQQVAQTTGDRFACLMPSAFAALAQLPPQRLLTPIDLGSHTLLYTPHSMVSAPYHRDQQGVRDTFRFFNDPITEARGILDKRGIDLVVTCPAMPELDGQPDAAPDSFVKLAKTNQLPAWLNEIDTGGPLKIYRVLPQPAQ